MLKFSPKKRLKNIWNFLCSMLLHPNKTILHTTSVEERDFSLTIFPRVKAVVIGNGVDTPLVLPKRDYCPNGKLRLLFLSRLHRKKGLENLLDAMVELKDLKISLSIYGAGDKAYVSSLQERAQRLGLLDDTVCFLGQADGESKKNAFMNADVFVLPSYSENYGIAIAEALSYGVPVIASHGAPWQKIEEKKCGLWVENTPQSLAQAVRAIRQMDLADMGKCGWQWMKDDYSWHTIASQMFEIYFSATNK
jgi:glycosyltransferase involved in cell wall biosynthesis